MPLCLYDQIIQTRKENAILSAAIEQEKIENRDLREKLKTQQESTNFIEDCIAEMAAIIYA